MLAELRWGIGIAALEGRRRRRASLGWVLCLCKVETILVLRLFYYDSEIRCGNEGDEWMGSVGVRRSIVQVQCRWGLVVVVS